MRRSESAGLSVAAVGEPKGRSVYLLSILVNRVNAPWVEREGGNTVELPSLRRRVHSEPVWASWNQ